MNSLREGISEYLELRRSLGFRLKKDERLLLDFADVMEQHHAPHITAKRVVGLEEFWCCFDTGAKHATLADAPWRFLHSQQR